MIFKFIILVTITALAQAEEETAELSADITRTLQEWLQNSYHVPPGLNSDLNLSSRELKMFSGFALKMFKSKCPAISQHKLFSIHRLMGKVLADGVEVEVAKGRPIFNPRFMSLLESLRTCSNKEDRILPPREIPEMKSKHFVISHPNGKLVVYQSSKSHPLLKPAGKEESDGAIRLDFSEGKEDEAEGVTIRYPKETSMEKAADWFESVLHQVKSFFVETIPKAYARVRGVELVTETPKPWEISLKKARHSVQELMDQVCRIFCSQCQEHYQSRTLRMAARELLDNVMKDDNVVRVLATIMDDNFIESIENCHASTSVISMETLIGLARRKQAEKRFIAKIHAAEAQLEKQAAIAQAETKATDDQLEIKAADAHIKTEAADAQIEPKPADTPLKENFQDAQIPIEPKAQDAQAEPKAPDAQAEPKPMDAPIEPRTFLQGSNAETTNQKANPQGSPSPTQDSFLQAEPGIIGGKKENPPALLPTDQQAAALAYFDEPEVVIIKAPPPELFSERAAALAAAAKLTAEVAVQEAEAAQAAAEEKMALATAAALAAANAQAQAVKAIGSFPQEQEQPTP